MRIGVTLSDLGQLLTMFFYFSHKCKREREKTKKHVIHIPPLGKTSFYRCQAILNLQLFSASQASGQLTCSGQSQRSFKTLNRSFRGQSRLSKVAWRFEPVSKRSMYAVMHLSRKASLHSPSAWTHSKYLPLRQLYRSVKRPFDKQWKYSTQIKPSMGETVF